jgi:hypothetical protein
MLPVAPYDLWHQPLGILGRKKVAGLNSTTTSLAQLIEIPKHIPSCDTCLQSKFCQTNLRFITLPSTKTFERVHTDFCGTLQYTGMDGEP